MSKTKNIVLKEVTEAYLQGLNSANPSSPDTIQSDIVAQVGAEYRKINATLLQGQKKWVPPEALEPAQIALIMHTLYPIHAIKAGGENANDANSLLSIYCDSGESEGIYVDSDKVLSNLAGQFKFALSKWETEEVIFHLRNLAPEVYRTTDPDLIAVNNGIFNYKTKKLLPFDPKYIFTSKSRVNYVENPPLPVITNPDGTTWDVESWMSEIMGGDPEMTQLAWEICGAVVRPHVRWNKSAWLYSTTGNNGKGTLCELLRNLVGRGSYASIPLSDFGKAFALEPLTRAQAIIVDENDVGQFIDKAANLKAVITNDVIPVNRKFKVPIAYQFFGFMVQCLNEMPRVKDKSDSFYRRQLFVPFTKCFTGQERKYIKDDYLKRPEVLEYVLHKVLNMDYYSLSEPAACRITLAEYKEYNDPIRQFADEILPLCVWDFLPFTFLYDLYKSWYKKNRPEGKAVGNKTFLNELVNLVNSDASSAWMCPDKAKLVRTGSMMAKPEPLILQYNLEDWRNPSYRGPNPDIICMPVLTSAYRGIIRKSVQNPQPGAGSTSKTGN